MGSAIDMQSRNNRSVLDYGDLGAVHWRVVVLGQLRRRAGVEARPLPLAAFRSQLVVAFLALIPQTVRGALQRAEHVEKHGAFASAASLRREICHLPRPLRGSGDPGGLARFRRGEGGAAFWEARHGKLPVPATSPSG